MALIKCSECGKFVSDKSSICPNCGNPLAPATKKPSTPADHGEQAPTPSGGTQFEMRQSDKSNLTIKWIAAMLAGALMAVIAMGIFTHYNKQKSVDAEVIVSPDTAQSKALDYQEDSSKDYQSVAPKENIEAEQKVANYDESMNTSVGLAVKDWNLLGYMVKGQKRYPIRITFHQEGDKFTNGLYRNITYDRRIRLNVSKTIDGFEFKGKDGSAPFTIKVDGGYDESSWDGYFTSGATTLVTHLEE